MIPPTPGADPASRLFGYATPPDGAGPIGPDQYWPVAINPSRDEMRNSMNPLHYVPVVGTIYRAVTNEEIPAPMRVLGAGLTGGPLSALGAGVFGIFMAILTMKPDLSRPASPEGMPATGSEAGMAPVTPGTLAAGAYTTLATSAPEWLQGTTMLAGGDPARGAAAYATASMEWQRSEAWEKGLA